jgi:hypothetical protein
MKYIILLLLVFATNVAAQEQPKYLKDAVITVTLKGGKQYSYSANEYAVIKRNSKPSIQLAETQKQEEVKQVVKASEPKRLRHIVSGELLRSNGGFDSKSSGSQVKVESRKKMGVGLMYQYNVYKDMFLGGRLDSNGRTGINVGVGF